MSEEDMQHVDKADMVEVRTDLFESAPRSSKDMLITFRDGYDPGFLPEGFNGMIDVGEGEVPCTSLEVVSSYHDYGSTPSFDLIKDMLRDSKADVAKGAFNVSSFLDLHNIHRASRTPRRHVLLGMGEAGTITRIRGRMLGNEFTFAYVSEQTAPGQLSLDEMDRFKDDCMVTGLVGRSIGRSRSKIMHDRAFDACGIKGYYCKFEVNGLQCMDEAIREYDIRGLNITMPFKEDALGMMDSLDQLAEDVGCINTIVNDGGTLKGYNTDVKGIRVALERGNIDSKGMDVLIMGCGGAARACAKALSQSRMTVVGRNREGLDRFSRDIGCETRIGTISPDGFDLIVNCTPIGWNGDDGYPMDLSMLDGTQAIFDMVYGTQTPLIGRAKDVGAPIALGEDMLTGQGMESFRLWTGKEVDFNVMRV